MPEAPQPDHRRRVPGTKLAVPDLPPRRVPRRRLLAMLDVAGNSTATLVNAPAGAGKTLLLAEWVRTRAGAATAWVSLDADDNDDRRFWSALLGALSASRSVPEASALRRLAVPASPSTDPGFVAEVVNALDDLPSPVLLVLDDVHELTSPQALHGLESLLKHRPAGLRLILSTRRDPHVPLARLRLADQLTEIRADHLRFTPDEARAMLAAAGIDLDPDQLHRLLEQTEGWAAGLRLATLSLSTTTDREQWLADFAANDRAVAEYLIEEVLSRLPADTLDLLSTVSVCEQVSTELATHLSGRADAGALLEAIAESSSLVIRVDTAPHRYQVHALLRSYLLADLVRQDPDRAASAHAAAADWFADRGDPASALAHACEAGDTVRATTLLHRHAVALALSGNHELIRNVLDLLGARQVVEDALLALVSALVHLERGEPPAADRDLAHADSVWPDRPSAELVSLRALVRSRIAQFAGDVDVLVQVTADMAGSPDAPALLQLGTALLSSGRRAAAGDQLRAALRVARAGHHDYVAMQCQTMLGGLAGAEGDYGLMVALAHEADEEIVRHGWQQTAAGATAALLLSYGALLSADPAECLRQAGRAGLLVDAGEPPAMQGLNLLVGTLRGAAEFELGDRIAGARRIHRTRVAGGDLRFADEQIALCAVFEHRTAQLLGWAQGAAAAQQWGEARIPDSGEVHLMQARSQLTLGRRDAAAKTIQPVLDGSVAPVLPWTLVDAWLLFLEIALSSDDVPRARRALKKALQVGSDLGVPYPLVFATPEVIKLLTGELGKLGPAERFADRVFTLRSGLHVLPMVPLTARERTVLRLLPTLRSFEEIADDLTVSVNTVKTHVRAIYTKLGVTQRRDAVAAALERGLLESDTAPR